MKLYLKRLLLLCLFIALPLNFGFSQSGENEVPAESENTEDTDYKEGSFTHNLTSLKGHRFIECHGAIPYFPVLTTHGVVQSFSVAFADVFGEIFSAGNEYEKTTPKFATDLNITVFPPIANSRLGFLAGIAIDTWDTTIKHEGISSKETLSMNYAYLGFHGDYGHWVFNDIGARLSLYGEICLGWLFSDDGRDSDKAFCFDFCPFGIQFCPEKHIGIYFEIPHLGARPFFETGISIGF